MVSNLVYQLGFANFNFPFAAALCVAGLLPQTYLSIFVMRLMLRGQWKKSGCIEMAKPLSPPDNGLDRLRRRHRHPLASIILPAVVARHRRLQRQGAPLSRRNNCRCAGFTRQ